MRKLLVLLVAVACGSAALASTDMSEPGEETAGASAIEALDAQLAAVAKTDALLADKYQARVTELRRRVRASYKLLRAGSPLWVDAEQRSAAVQRRATVRRMLSHTMAELTSLHQEVAMAARAREYLEEVRRGAASAAAPTPGTLPVPVSPGDVVKPFGIHRHRNTSTRLTRRGIELSSRTGHPVHAVAAGEARYAGPVRGLGHAVIVAHPDAGFLSVVGHLADTAIQRGQRVERGQVLGHADGERIYLEIRLAVGAGGYPVDPEPLLVPLPTNP